MHTLISRIAQQEDINFLLTNRLPRRLVTRFMGWFSRIKNPLIRNLSISVWKLFANDLDLSEASKSKFDSLHDCFIRELKPGARAIEQDADVVISPCDAIIGEVGNVEDGRVYQAKGFPYQIHDLLDDPVMVERYRNGLFVTLRLTSTMYHRFHAPCDCRIKNITYISGDTWNVNPIALKRVEQLFCKNERVVLDLDMGQPGLHLTLVPVAAILVASINLHCLPQPLDLKYKGPNHIECEGGYRKGDELGYFQHGSTIIIFANNAVRLMDDIKTGERIKMGQSLFIKT